MKTQKMREIKNQQARETEKNKVLAIIDAQIRTEMQIREDNFPLLATETRVAIETLRALRQQIETQV